MRVFTRVLVPLALVTLLVHPAPTAAQAPMVNKSANPLLTNFRFRSIGPASMGGRIDDIEVAPSDQNIIYIGYAVGGVWKSENNGTTWTPVFDEQPVASIGDIAIHPTNANIVYVGTGEANNRQTSSFGDGMYKTTDGGKTWQHIGLRETQSIARVVIDPRNPEVVYVAAAGRLFGPNQDRGVYKTTDGGKTWNKVKYVDENTGFTDLVMHPTNSSIVYAASYQRRRSGCCFVGGGPGSGLWKTTDAGRTWTKVTGAGLAPGTYGRIALDVAKSNPNVIYVQAEAGEVGQLGVAPPPAPAAPAEGAAPGGGGRGGYDWCNNGGPGGGFPVGGGGGRAGADVPGPQKPALDIKQGGVFRTEDGGRTWTHMTNCNARPMYFSQIRVDPSNPNTVFVAGLPMAKSLDGGKTFTTLDEAGGNGGPGHVDHHAFWVDPKNGKHLLAGNDGGFNVSWDQGKTWDYVNTMATALSYWVAADMRRPYRVYTGLQDNGSWGGPSAVRGQDGILNSHWFGVGGGDGFQTAIDPTAYNIIFTESQNGNTTRYDLFTGAQQSVRPVPPAGGGRGGAAASACVDGRVTTAAGGRGGGGGGGGRGGGRGNILNAQPGDDARFNWNTPFQLSPHNPRVLWLGGARLYRSDNQGETWVQSADLTRRIDRCNVTLMGMPGNTTQLSKNDGVTSYSTIIAVSESPVARGVVWAGTDDGNLQVSRDNGTTFTDVSRNLPGLPANHEHWIARIDGSHFEAGTAYIAVDGHRSDDLKPYAFVTTDYGRTFRSISSNLPAYGNLQVIREDPKNPDLLYVGTEFGLFISLNRGQSWEKFMNNYPTVRTDDILVHPRDGDLIVGSHGRAVYIADDITPLQQLTQAVRDADAHLFDVRPAVAYITDRQDNQQVAGQKVWRGENAPRGAAINYYLKNAAAGAVTLAITDLQGRTLCSGTVANTAGINRVQWGLTAPALAGAGGAAAGGGGGGGGGRGGAQAGPPNTSCAGGGGGGRGGGGGFGGGGGGAVDAGTYIATLTVGGRTISKSVEVLADVWMNQK